MAIFAEVASVEQVATEPPDPPYLLEFTITSTWLRNGTWAVATASARALSTVKSLSIGEPANRLQNLASRKVRGVVLGEVQSPATVGSSAPLSVETMSTRCTLMPQKSSSNGGVVRSSARKFSTSWW